MLTVVHELITLTSRRWYVDHSDACRAADRHPGPAIIATHNDTAALTEGSGNE